MKRSGKDLHDIAYAGMEVACMAYWVEEESPDALDARRITRWGHCGEKRMLAVQVDIKWLSSIRQRENMLEARLHEITHVTIGDTN